MRSPVGGTFPGRRPGWSARQVFATAAVPASHRHRCQQAVLQLRRDKRRGQDWIGAELGIAARTVSAILRRHGVPYLRECDPLTGEVIRASKTTAIRYEHPYPGSLVHMDVKKIGRIRDGGGWKAHGRAMGNRAHERNLVGFNYVHSLVDDHSRLAYSEVLDDEKGSTCAAVPAPRRRLLRRPWHHPHRAGHDRQPPQLQAIRRCRGRDGRCWVPAHVFIRAALPLAERGR